MKYVIISPVKDEEKYILKTIKAIVNQTLKPVKWIIVDDGSLDRTKDIVLSFVKDYDWIDLVEKNTHEETRLGGQKVVRAFKAGFNQIDTEYDFLVKLDGDLFLPKNYFRIVSNLFEKNPRLGLCGGLIFNKINTHFIKEESSKYHIRGAFKAIKKECFEDIGGFREIRNWDGVDELDAIRKGWRTHVFNLPVFHFKPTSSKYDPLTMSKLSGTEAYKMRSSPLLVLLRGLSYLSKSPKFLYTITYFKSYILAFIMREKAILEKDLSNFINNFHIKRILKLSF
jgi:glycosyltransferase involved in cell wall biosynthesis